jgi:hypothetical protein
MCVCVCVCFGALPSPACPCCRRPSTAPPPRLHALYRPPRAALCIHPAKTGLCRVRVVLACCIAVRTVNQTHRYKKGGKNQGIRFVQPTNRAYTHTITREKYVLKKDKHIKHTYNYIITKVLRPHTLVAEGLTQ